MRFRRASIAFLGLLLATTAHLAFAAAPAAATDAQIDRLLTITRAKDTVAAMLPQLRASQQQMVAQMAAGQSFTPEQRAKFDAIMDKVSDRTAQMLAWDKLEPMYRDLYKQTFDGDDLEAMIDFYSSASGQKVLDKMPQLMQNMMAGVQKLIMPVMQDMQKDLEAEIAKSHAAEPEDAKK